MAILKDSDEEELARLLELFPVSRLREVWSALAKDAKTKTELCKLIAGQRSYSSLTNFVDGQFGCTKQHVHVFSRDGSVDLPETITDGERVKTVATRHLYLAAVERGVLMEDPPERDTITFLWPIRIELPAHYMVVRFVVLEKNLAAYFPRKAYPTDRGITEQDVLQGLKSDLPNIAPADLTKGIKKLWRDGFMDGFHAKYKTPDSVASETMDEEKGIRENKPELFKTLMKSPLTQMIFNIDPEEKLTLRSFSADPSLGTLAFHTYSANAGDTDRVIRDILQNN